MPLLPLRRSLSSRSLSPTDSGALGSVVAVRWFRAWGSACVDQRAEALVSSGLRVEGLRFQPLQRHV